VKDEIKRQPVASYGQFFDVEHERVLLSCLHATARAKQSLEIAVQWIEPDGFGLAVETIGGTTLRPALCLTQTQPVAGAIARPGKAGRIDKGLSQQNGMAVCDLPVATQTPEVCSENARRQMALSDPWQNQKAYVVDNLTKIDLLGRRVPSDATLAQWVAQRCRAPAQKSDQLTAEKRGIANGLADERTVSQVVKPLHVGSPTELFVFANWPHYQRRTGMDVHGPVERGADKLRGKFQQMVIRSSLPTTGGRQANDTCPIKSNEQVPACSYGPCAARATPPEQLAGRPSNLLPRPPWPALDHASNFGELASLEHSPAEDHTPRPLAISHTFHALRSGTKRRAAPILRLRLQKH